jgi:6-phosphofructokinase
MQRGWQLYDQWAAAGRMADPKKSSNFASAKMKPRIGVLTSGGDCPGLNAVLRAVVLASDKLGWEVVGFRDGFEGLLPPGNHVILDRQAVNGIMALGGTILGTTNRGHFVQKSARAIGHRSGKDHCRRQEDPGGPLACER